MRAEWAKETEGYQAGDVYLRNIPQAESRAQTQDVRSRSIVLPVSLLHAVADAECTPPAPLRFLSTYPAGADARAQWQNTSDYAERVLANPEAAASPLIIGSTARLLAATALAIFPNTALLGPGARDRSDASPATLRRAITFIDEHAHDDITSAEIAAAAGVTIRAVQLAFRHLDTTPLGYLRRVRLHYAHRQLAAADAQHEALAGLLFVRNWIGRGARLGETVDTSAGARRITQWTWKPIGEPAPAGLPPRAQAWELARYRAYQACLAGHTIGKTFGEAVVFLARTGANATSSTDTTKSPPVMG